MKKERKKDLERNFEHSVEKKMFFVVSVWQRFSRGSCASVSMLLTLFYADILANFRIALDNF